MIESGMYLTQKSVYIVYKKNDIYSVYKNNEELLDNVKKIDYFDNRLYFLKEVGEISYVTGPIIESHRILSKDTLLQGMEKIADTLIEKGAKPDKYYNYVENFIKGEEKPLLDLFNSCESVNQCSAYKKYSSSDYGTMAMLIREVKEAYPGTIDLFLKNKKISGILHDMAIDTNGLASQVENKVNEDKPLMESY